jgi:hypothetical protein
MKLRKIEYKIVEAVSDPISKKANKRAISRFSRHSIQNFIFTLKYTKVKWATHLTLCFEGTGYPTSGPMLKRDISTLTHWLKSCRPGFKYLWRLKFLETARNYTCCFRTM